MTLQQRLIKEFPELFERDEELYAELKDGIFVEAMRRSFDLHVQHMVYGEIARAGEARALVRKNCAHEFSDSIGLLSDVCSKCGMHDPMDDIAKHPIGYDAGMF